MTVKSPYIKLFALLVAFLLIVAGVSRTAAQEQQPRKTTDERATYPHNIEGIQQQFEDVLRAFRNGQRENAQQLLERFCVQKPEKWLGQLFDSKDPQNGIEKYRQGCASTTASISSTLELLAKMKDASIQISAGTFAAGYPVKLAPNANGPKLEIFRIALTGDGKRVEPFQEIFVYTDGAFQYLLPDPSGGIPPPPPSPPQRIRIGGNVLRAKLISQVPPVYPPEAAREHIEGTVRVQVVIAKDGTVLEVQMLSGHPLFAEAAMDAVRKWRFRPTLLNGATVEVVSTVDVFFSLK